MTKKNQPCKPKERAEAMPKNQPYKPKEEAEPMPKKNRLSKPKEEAEPISKKNRLSQQEDKQVYLAENSQTSEISVSAAIVSEGVPNKSLCAKRTSIRIALRIVLSKCAAVIFAFCCYALSERLLEYLWRSVGI